MLRIWKTEDGASRVALRLSGSLGGPWVSELERLCEGLFCEGKGITLDLSDVGFIDERGVAAIQLVSSRGATVTSTSPFVATRLRDYNGVDGWGGSGRNGLMSLNVATTQTANPLLKEQLLLSGLRAGEERAFETLVREQTRRLLPMARRFLGSSEDARDAVQETLLAAIQSLPTFRGEARLSTWIRHIGVNQCLMILRKRRRHPEVDIEPLLPTFDESGHSQARFGPWETKSSSLEERETQALVRQLIDELPETYRTVLLLRDIEELSTEEVASLLAVSRNTVKVRLHRARQALRSLLEPHMKRGSL